MPCGRGSEICTQNGTLVNGNMDCNLRSPGGLILTHTHVPCAFRKAMCPKIGWQACLRWHLLVAWQHRGLPFVLSKLGNESYRSMNRSLLESPSLPLCGADRYSHVLRTSRRGDRADRVIQACLVRASLQPEAHSHVEFHGSIAPLGSEAWQDRGPEVYRCRGWGEMRPKDSSGVTSDAVPILG